MKSKILILLFVVSLVAGMIVPTTASPENKGGGADNRHTSKHIQGGGDKGQGGPGNKASGGGADNVGGSGNGQGPENKGGSGSKGGK